MRKRRAKGGSPFRASPSVAIGLNVSLPLQVATIEIISQIMTGSWERGAAVPKEVEHHHALFAKTIQQPIFSLNTVAICDSILTKRGSVSFV